MSKSWPAHRSHQSRRSLAVAYQIEADAVDRYNCWPTRWRRTTTRSWLQVFRDLARAEGIHRDEIRRVAGDFDVVAHAQRLAKWQMAKAPKQPDLGCRALSDDAVARLQLALAAEQRASHFFKSIVDSAKDPEIKKHGG